MNIIQKWLNTVIRNPAFTKPDPKPNQDAVEISQPKKEEPMSTEPNPKNPNAHLTASQRGIDFVHQFEQLRLTAYDDKQPNRTLKKGDKILGTMTIGWGSTRYEDGSRVQIGDTITKERADRLFDISRREKEAQVKRLITRPLKQNEFDALFSFQYNAGTGNPPYNLWKHVNNRLSGEAMRKYWSNLAITSGGVVMGGLKRRRAAEVAMYLGG